MIFSLGFPVFVFGTSDMEKHFHPCGLAVSKDEESQDFPSVFKAIKKGAEYGQPTYKHQL